MTNNIEKKEQTKEEQLKEAIANVLCHLHNQKTAWGDTKFLQLAQKHADKAWELVK